MSRASKRAIKYFEENNRRVLLDISLFENDLLSQRIPGVAVAHMAEKEGFIAFTPLEGRVHVFEASDANKLDDDLVISGTIKGGDDITVVFRHTAIGKPIDRFFNRGISKAGEREIERLLEEALVGAIEDPPLPSPPKKGKKDFKVVEVGVMDYPTGLFETGGVIAVRGKTEAAFVPSIKYRDKISNHFEERIRRVKSAVLSGEEDASFVKWINYLVEGGGQGEFSFSSPEKISAPSAQLAATKRLVRALRGTDLVRE